MSVDRLPGPVTVIFHVRYAECDPMQVAHHANYFVWFEMGRAAYCRARGVDYNQMERDGLFLPIVEARCRYIASARYDDELCLAVQVTERKKRTIRFRYVLHRGATLLAEATTYQILVDGEGRPRTWPEEIAIRFTPDTTETARERR